MKNYILALLLVATTSTFSILYQCPNDNRVFNTLAQAEAVCPGKSTASIIDLSGYSAWPESGQRMGPPERR